MRYLPEISSIVLITFLPGLLLVLAGRPATRPLLAVAQAPAWTFGLVALLSAIQPQLPIRWGLIPFIIATVIAAAVAFGVHGVITRKWRPDLSLWRNRYDWQMLAFALVIWLIAIAPIVLTSNASNPVQGGDSNYHYNQLWLMERTGNASPLESNATMAGVDPLPWYYPNAWHALLSLVTVGPQDALAVTNASLVVTPLIFLLGAAAFAMVAAKEEKVYPWGLLAASFAPLALTRLALATTLWPFVLAFAALPGLIAAIIDNLGKTSIRRIVLTFGIFLLPLIGVFAVHPSVLLPLSIPLFALVVAYLLWRGWLDLQNKRYARGVGVVALAAFFVAAAYLFMILPGPQRYYFARFPKVEWDNIIAKIFFSTSMFLPGGGAYAVLFYAAVCVLTLAAIFVAWRKRRHALVIAWFSQWLIVLGSYLPIDGISHLTALYYSNPNRAEFAAAVFLVPMLGILFYEAASWLAKRQWKLTEIPLTRTLGVCTVIMLAVTAYGFKGVAHDTKTTFNPSEDNVRYLATPEEVEMIKSAADILPKDAYVLGDPAAGAALLQPLSNIRVVWPYPNYPQTGLDAFLLQRFRLIDSDPFICKILNDHGIKYFYDDKARYYNGGYTDELRPGLYGVDTSKGFTKLASGGSATLYRIDACNK